MNRLKEILKNDEISDNAKVAFRSANYFYEKLIKGCYTETYNKKRNYDR